ncbi:hypothetical protein HY604_01395 [Candidatus Peregrinibacteria bacterium]|nr:hypothetical protein [Candidatus Peregrinibacteria bacterium]
MNDNQLYELCKKYGRNALESRRKFIGLLPEVLRRRLYEKKRFSSIYEFAAKLAGVSHEQVDLALRLEKKFENKPVLRKALIEGEISINKLTRVAAIATEQNQKELFERTKTFSNRAIETFVRDVKNKNEDASSKPLFEAKSMHVHALKLDEDVENALVEMQEKGIDINEFLRNVLQKRKDEIEKLKEKIVAEQQAGKTTRYFQVKIKKLIRQEHGTKCSYPNCTKPAKALHHTQRFALINIHDPHFIAPLCEAHHEIAHKIDVQYAEISRRH